jgi:hypothetical protein
MLQGAALEAWHYPGADDYRRQVDFTGVFIPADRSWSAQIASMGDRYLEPEHQRLLGIAAFTTHVLRALITAIEYRTNPPQDPTLTPHRRMQLSRDGESALVKELAIAWLLTPTVPSLLALRYALTARLSSILELSSSERVRGAAGRSERLAAARFLHLHFIAAAGIAVEIFDSLAEEGGRWALLFDEMELAPSWIREELIGCLRSTDARFLFKLY